MAVNELIGLEDYREALKQPGIAVVDFYSTQCPPCKVRRRNITRAAIYDSLTRDITGHRAILREHRQEVQQ